MKLFVILSALPFLIGCIADQTNQTNNSPWVLKEDDQNISLNNESSDVKILFPSNDDGGDSFAEQADAYCSKHINLRNLGRHKRMRVDLILYIDSMYNRNCSECSSQCVERDLPNFLETERFLKISNISKNWLHLKQSKFGRDYGYNTYFFLDINSGIEYKINSHKGYLEIWANEVFL
jgi:hypothetical protein